MWKSTGKKKSVEQDIQILICDVCGKAIIGEDSKGEYPMFTLEVEWRAPFSGDDDGQAESFELCSPACVRAKADKLQKQKG